LTDFLINTPGGLIVIGAIGSIIAGIILKLGFLKHLWKLVAGLFMSSSHSHEYNIKTGNNSPVMINTGDSSSIKNTRNAIHDISKRGVFSEEINSISDKSNKLLMALWNECPRIGGWFFLTYDDPKWSSYGNRNELLEYLKGLRTKKYIELRDNNNIATPYCPIKFTSLGGEKAEELLKGINSHNPQ